MPLFDPLGGTINAKSWELQKEVDQGMNDRVPNFVFLAHVVYVVSSTQVPFAFRSCSSLPFTTHLMLLPLWPVAFAFMLLQWFCSKTFTVSFYFLRGRLHHTWSIPIYGFQVRAAREGRGQHRQPAAEGRSGGLGEGEQREHLGLADGGALVPPGAATTERERERHEQRRGARERRRGQVGSI
ncbi:protein ECERIFERUM 3-like [Panicum hallii]|nr:protein ECERIFERUM 3-like [Panicum hallii]